MPADKHSCRMDVKGPPGGVRLQRRAGWSRVEGEGIDKCSSKCPRQGLPPGSELSVALLWVILEVLHDLTQSLFVLDDPGQRSNTHTHTHKLLFVLVWYGTVTKIIGSIRRRTEPLSSELMGSEHSKLRGCNGSSYLCLISWICSWQLWSSGWSWACCLASCSLAVCWEGTSDKIYANHSSAEDGGKADD